MFARTLCLLALATLSTAFLNDGIFDPPTTVDELDVTKYIGLWYQMYASPIVYETFEKDAVCVTAEYQPYNETTVTVYNANRDKTPDGEYEEISGFAYLTEDPGKLLVDLSGGVSSEFYAPYWVIKLGPIENDEYQYSIVSDPTRLYLFVLTRDATTWGEKFDAEVTKYLAENGFDSALNRPIKTYHGPDCLYRPVM